MGVGWVWFGVGVGEWFQGVDATSAECAGCGVHPLKGFLPGGVLLSHTPAGAVPSALKGLASGFGMGPGVSPSL